MLAALLQVLSRWACCLASRARYRDHVRRCSRRGRFQGQRSWTAINAPPWHLQHHTSHRNTICIPILCMPTPHTSMTQFNPAAALFRNRYTLTKNPTPSTPNIHHTICPLPHCRRARQRQRAWTAINAPPWHLQHHTSHRNTICIPTLCMPTPHTSMT